MYPSEHGEKKSDNELLPSENPNSNSSRPGTRPTSAAVVDNPPMLGTVPKNLSSASIQSHHSANSAANLQVTLLGLQLIVNPVDM